MYSFHGANHPIAYAATHRRRRTRLQLSWRAARSLDSQPRCIGMDCMRIDQLLFSLSSFFSFSLTQTQCGGGTRHNYSLFLRNDGFAVGYFESSADTFEEVSEQMRLFVCRSDTHAHTHAPPTCVRMFTVTHTSPPPTHTHTRARAHTHTHPSHVCLSQSHPGDKACRQDRGLEAVGRDHAEVHRWWRPSDKASGSEQSQTLLLPWHGSGVSLVAVPERTCDEILRVRVGSSTQMCLCL